MIKVDIFVIFSILLLFMVFLSMFFVLKLIKNYFKYLKSYNETKCSDLSVKIITCFTFISGILFFCSNILLKIPEEGFKNYLFNLLIFIFVIILYITFIKFLEWINSKFFSK